MKKRSDGRWTKSVTINGKRVFFYSTAATERQAIKDIEKQMLEYQGKEERGKTLNEVIDNWMSVHFEDLEYNTQKYYNASIKQIKQYFGSTQIKSIEPADIKRFMSYLENQKYSLKTVKARKLALNLIFNYALGEKEISSNPCAGIKIPKHLKKTRREAPDEQELQTVISNLDTEFGFFAYFILYTGLRRGEALALQYSDIDFENKTITVNKSVFHKSNVPYVKTPKTAAGIRTVILLDNLIPHLKNRKKTKDKNELVFGNSNNELLTNGQFQGLWERYTRLAGLDITPHQLRHGYATILFEAGIDEKDAQELMGHTTIQLTRDIYTHISKTRKKLTAERLNNFVISSIS